MTNPSEPSSKRFSIPFLLMLGVTLFAFVQTFSLLSPIYLSFLLTLLISLALNPLVNKAPLVAIVSMFHEELYRKKLLPTVNDADLDELARKVLHEKSLVSD